MAKAYTPEAFSKLVIPTACGGRRRYRSFRFGEVGQVEDGLNDVRRLSRRDGPAGGGLWASSKQRGTNAVQVADNVKQRIKDIQPLLPKAWTSSSCRL